MYENQTEITIRNRMLELVSNDLDKSEGSFIYDALAPVASELSQMYIQLDQNLLTAFLQTTFGDYLTSKAAEFGITRKAGTKAVGTVTFSGANSTIIPKDTVVQTADGLQFKTTADGTISSGTVTVNIEALAIGDNYNVPSSTIIVLPVLIVGVTSLTNSVQTTGGTDVETDTDLVSRTLTKVATPAASGNINDYINWALEVTGVGGVKVYPLWNGNGTVKLAIIDSDKTAADSAIVTAVSTYVDAEKPIGAAVTVVSATELTITISVTIVRDTAYTLQQTKDNITAAITAYLKSIAFVSSYVSYARIGNCIMESAGVTDYSNLTVNGGTTNISITYTSATTQTPVIGVVTVNE